CCSGEEVVVVFLWYLLGQRPHPLFLLHYYHFHSIRTRINAELGKAGHGPAHGGRRPVRFKGVQVDERRLVLSQDPSGGRSSHARTEGLSPPGCKAKISSRQNLRSAHKQ